MGIAENSFVDFVRVTVKGGDGGNGAISFRREKYVPFGGPDGGDGGKGGDVVFEADRQIVTLLDVKLHSNITADRGANGKNKNKTGRSGEDIVVKVPLGTVVTDDVGEVVGELTEPGQRLTAAAGGLGGAGNQHYPTSTHQAPRKAKDGQPGQERALVLELKLIADAGLIGLPNAGKSTLLKTLTHANPRVAPYPFTTLHPNLGIMAIGEYESVTLADIPGLVEGASRGVGLGDRFLRHIERTALLIHLVAPDPSHMGDPEKSSTEEAEIGAHFALDAYHLVRQELTAYSPEIVRKPELVVLTKTDLLSPEEVAKYLDVFRAEGIEAVSISADAGEGLEELRNAIEKRLRAIGRLGDLKTSPSTSATTSAAEAVTEKSTGEPA